ncbi:MAG TPA: beta-glucosidase, partial [Cytophagales bacterium]|nr:beta-glucosidase [Cytophagales bacterium]
RETARQAARESITLLKNQDDILPLPSGAKVLVTGPNANSMRTLNGGWTYTWQGDRTDQFVSDELTIVEALQNTLGEANVRYAEGVRYTPGAQYWADELVDLGAVRRAAVGVDYIVLCLGENSYTEKPGDLNSLMLSENQQDLAEVAITTGKPVILVLNEGRPRIITNLEREMDAVLQLYLPGNHGGEALAEILTGATNPSGKLPYTYPRHVNDLIPYHHKFSENVPHNDGNEYLDPFFNPLYEFGHGLSYTTFAYSGLSVKASENSPNGELTVKVTVANTGDRDGAEVVQLYSTDVVATITPSVKRLRAFEKIKLAAGTSQEVSFTLPISAMSFINRTGESVLEAGEFIINVGDQQETFELQ